MTKFERAVIPQSERDRVFNGIFQQCLNDPDFAMKHFGTNNPVTLEKSIRQFLAEESSGEVWLNDTYQVLARLAKATAAWPEMVYLSIKRLDKEPIWNWRHFQTIKTELVGPHNEGVMLLPDEDRVIDTSNQYHVFCLADPTIRFPFGFNEGRIQDTQSVAGSKQQPFEEPT